MATASLLRKCKYRVLAINGVEDDNFADVSPYLVATAADLPVPPATVTRDDPPSTKTAIEVHWSPVTSDDDTGGDVRGESVGSPGHQRLEQQLGLKVTRAMARCLFSSLLRYFKDF